MKVTDDRKAMLDAVLGPAGFKRKGNSYVRALDDGVQQWIGLRRSRLGDGSASILFAGDAASAESGRFHGMSWVAPFKNSSSSWPERFSEGDGERLRHQLANVVLPYLDSCAGEFDPSESARRMFACLDDLSAPGLGFERKGDSYFRRRGPVIDIVDVDLVGDGRFAYVSVAVWHKKLEKGIDMSLAVEDRIPDGITRVASHTIGPAAVDAVPFTSLLFLGASRPGTLAASSSLVQVAASYFSRVNDVRDVLDEIRPEYRSMFSA
jgi:hypothetical protein